MSANIIIPIVAMMGAAFGAGLLIGAARGHYVGVRQTERRWDDAVRRICSKTGCPRAPAPRP